MPSYAIDDLCIAGIRLIGEFSLLANFNCLLPLFSESRGGEHAS